MLTAPGVSLENSEVITTKDMLFINAKKIGDTIYIIENTVSESARETAYEKVKRLILNDTNNYHKKVS